MTLQGVVKRDDATVQLDDFGRESSSWEGGLKFGQPCTFDMSNRDWALSDTRIVVCRCLQVDFALLVVVP